jgi:hypothetical protein
MSRKRFVLFGVAALACPQMAHASACDVQISDLVQRTGARFIRFSPSGNNAFFEHRLFDSLTVECDLRFGPPVVAGYWSRNAYPPSEFFSTFAIAASVFTGDPPERIEPALRACNRRALNPRSAEMADTKVGNANIECHSFTRDGGSVGLSVNPIRR